MEILPSRCLSLITRCYLEPSDKLVLILLPELWPPRSINACSRTRFFEFNARYDHLIDNTRREQGWRSTSQRNLTPFLQSLICSLIIFAPLSAVFCLPIHSTKSPSGSVTHTHTVSTNFLSAIYFHESLLGEQRLRLTHDIEIYRMIHQIIHPRLRSLRRTEIHPVRLTHVLDLLPCSR